jgi:hypothetical protein
VLDCSIYCYFMYCIISQRMPCPQTDLCVSKLLTAQALQRARNVRLCTVSFIQNSGHTTLRLGFKMWGTWHRLVLVLNPYSPCHGRLSVWHANLAWISSSDKPPIWKQHGSWYIYMYCCINYQRPICTVTNFWTSASLASSSTDPILRRYEKQTKKPRPSVTAASLDCDSQLHAMQMITGLRGFGGPSSVTAVGTATPRVTWPSQHLSLTYGLGYTCGLA